MQLLTTIVKSLDEVTIPVWRGLQETCMSRPTIVSILYARGSPSIVREHMLEEYCSDLIMFHQWEVEGSEGWDRDRERFKESRIDRLGYLRSWQKDRLGEREEMIKSLDAVAVIDLDLLSLPTDSALSTAITTVNDPTKEDVVCANGYEKWLFTRHYYDTFALVFEDGTWAWPLLTSIKSILFLLQHDFHKKITSSAGNFAVQSCFGGLTVYNPTAFFHPTCNYRLTSTSPDPELTSTIARYSNDNGEACEHVILHMCLRHESRDEGGTPSLKVGIQPDMMLARDADIGGWNNPTLIYLVIFCLLSALIITRLRKSSDVLGSAYMNIRKRFDKMNKSMSPERNRKGSDDLEEKGLLNKEAESLRRLNTIRSMPNLQRFVTK